MSGKKYSWIVLLIFILGCTKQNSDVALPGASATSSRVAELIATQSPSSTPSSQVTSAAIAEATTDFPALFPTELDTTSPTVSTSTLTPTTIPTSVLPEAERTATPTRSLTENISPFSFATLPSVHPTLPPGDSIRYWVASNGIVVERVDEVTLRIDRHDNSQLVDLTMLDTRHQFGGYFSAENASVYFSIYDLNQDGESEVIVGFVFVGAYASVSSTILFYDQPSAKYINTEFVFNDLIPKDINLDGLVEFVMRDEQFNLVGLNGAHAIRVLSPIQILGFRDGEIANISSEFPQIIEADAARWFDEVTTNDCDLRGLDIYNWGAYLANMHVLGRGEEAWYFYDQHCGVDPEHHDYERFLAQRETLRDALIDYGYLLESD